MNCNDFDHAFDTAPLSPEAQEHAKGCNRCQELMRALSLTARARSVEAIDLVIDGLEIARSQGALAWELKLASTLVGIDDSGRARERLREIVNRTSEGFSTRDYREALVMLGQ